MVPDELVELALRPGGRPGPGVDDEGVLLIEVGRSRTAVETGS